MAGVETPAIGAWMIGHSISSKSSSRRSNGSVMHNSNTDIATVDPVASATMSTVAMTVFASARLHRALSAVLFDRKAAHAPILHFNLLDDNESCQAAC